MTKLNMIKSLLAVALLWSVFIITGCNKEKPVTPVMSATALTTTITNTNITKPVIAPRGTIGLPAVDSATFLKGFLGNEEIKIEGNAVSYNAYVDPDSTQHPGNGHNNDPDDDSYYLSGSKWVTFSGTGLTSASTNASVEIRSLAVRVFVTPINATSTNYFNLLQPEMYYPFADGDNTNTGAYITLHDKNGKLWTSTGDQDGSYLMITSRGANMNTYTVVSGTISCKMYDYSGNVKQLTGAKFTAALGI